MMAAAPFKGAAAIVIVLDTSNLVTRGAVVA